MNARGHRVGHNLISATKRCQLEVTGPRDWSFSEFSNNFRNIVRQMTVEQSNRRDFTGVEQGVDFGATTAYLRKLTEGCLEQKVAIQPLTGCIVDEYRRYVGPEHESADPATREYFKCSHCGAEPDMHFRCVKRQQYRQIDVVAWAAAQPGCTRRCGILAKQNSIESPASKLFPMLLPDPHSSSVPLA